MVDIVCWLRICSDLEVLNAAPSPFMCIMRDKYRGCILTTLLTPGDEDTSLTVFNLAQAAARQPPPRNSTLRLT